MVMYKNVLCELIYRGGVFMKEENIKKKMEKEKEVKKEKELEKNKGGIYIIPQISPNTGGAVLDYKDL